jgi:signal transduction histidine kinase
MSMSTDPDTAEVHVMVNLLQEELEQTNREVVALALELEERVEVRTADLRRAQDELRLANGELRKLATDLETRVAHRTAELARTNEALRAEIDVRRQAEQERQVQLDRLSLLNQITRAIAERQDLHSIYQVVVRTLEENLPVDFVCIGLYEPGERSLTVANVAMRGTAAGKGRMLETGARIPIDENGLAPCLDAPFIYEPDLTRLRYSYATRLANNGLRALVMTRLPGQPHASGLLLVSRRKAEAFSFQDCEFLVQLSEHIALAAHQSRLHSELQRAYDDLRQSQQTLMQQERLRALGQMASGIAHDVNNAISPITLYTDSLLERESGLSARGRSALVVIQRAIQDVAGTVARMREFYRPRESNLPWARVELNCLVDQVVNLTRARWSDLPLQRGVVIELRKELAAGLPDILGVEGEIRDSLTNLIFNAVDALPEGGTLTIRTRAVAADNRCERPEQVSVEVIDDGLGMDEDTRRHCLEPFYTTKGERGTGLGLSMVYGMTQRHGGTLELESEPGVGTCVRLIFPVIAGDQAAPQAIPAQESCAATTLRILLVDDDPLVGKVLRDVLEADGHCVTFADGGQRGIDLFLEASEAGQPFAVVLTDLGMPHIDGRQVAASVKGVSPGTPVILLTGWGNNLPTGDGPPLHVDRIVSKPPQMGVLRTVLAELTRLHET